MLACAAAEQLAATAPRSLVWLSLDCLIVQPPLLLDLGHSCDAASRPVHHRNVGPLASEPPDGYWQSIYDELGGRHPAHSVASFLDSLTPRPYLDTHCFAFGPAAGLCKEWWSHFQMLVLDKALQAGPCCDEAHQVFLHKAVLSTVVAQRLAWERVRLLPAGYNSPLNLISAALASSGPWAQRTGQCRLRRFVPLGGDRVHEPLLSWLQERLPA